MKGGDLMNKVAHIMNFLAFVLLTGCGEKQPITDELTKGKILS